VDFTKSCVNQDGQVGITLSVTGGDDDGVKFVVAGTTYRVKPGQSKLVVIGGLADGTHTIPITAGKNDMSVTVTIACDLPPVVTVSQECASFDGVISLLLDNPGDDLPATFTVNGTDHVVAPGASATVRIEGLADGSHTVTLAVNGVARPDIVVAFDCDPVFEVVARCNTVSSTGAVQVHWFTITNTESVDVTVAWPDGTVLVPAGESRTIASTAATLSIQYAGVSIASAEAGGVPMTVFDTVTSFEHVLEGRDGVEDRHRYPARRRGLHRHDLALGGWHLGHDHVVRRRARLTGDGEPALHTRPRGHRVPHRGDRQGRGQHQQREPRHHRALG
jgi:hypothetical protein